MRHTVSNSGRMGMTLVEMLIVISVIVILIGILVPSIAAYRTAAKKAKTSALINNICMGLDAYKSDHRSYPTVAGNMDHYHSLNRALYVAISGDVNQNLIRDIGDKPAYVEFPEGSVTSGGSIMDAFDATIGYWPFPDFHNRTSYNIWSRGPDGATGEGIDLGNQDDDINNWR